MRLYAKILKSSRYTVRINLIYFSIVMYNMSQFKVLGIIYISSACSMIYTQKNIEEQLSVCKRQALWLYFLRHYRTNRSPTQFYESSFYLNLNFSTYHDQIMANNLKNILICSCSDSIVKTSYYTVAIQHQNISNTVILITILIFRHQRNDNVNRKNKKQLRIIFL